MDYSKKFHDQLKLLKSIEDYEKWGLDGKRDERKGLSLLLKMIHRNEKLKKYETNSDPYILDAFFSKGGLESE